MPHGPYHLNRFFVTSFLPLISVLFLSMGLARLRAVHLPICNLVRLRAVQRSTQLRVCIDADHLWLKSVCCFVLMTSSWSFQAPMCSIHRRQWWVRALTPFTCSPSSLLLFVRIHCQHTTLTINRIEKFQSNSSFYAVK